jgi:hypothetical protein
LRRHDCPVAHSYSIRPQNALFWPLPTERTFSNPLEENKIRMPDTATIASRPVSVLGGLWPRNCRRFRRKSVIREPRVAMSAFGTFRTYRHVGYQVLRADHVVAGSTGRGLDAVLNQVPHPASDQAL